MTTQEGRIYQAMLSRINLALSDWLGGRINDQQFVQRFQEIAQTLVNGLGK